MTEELPTFSRVRHGYDVEQVAAYVGELRHQVKLARDQVQLGHDQVQLAHEEISQRTREAEQALAEIGELQHFAEALEAENDAHKQKFRSRYDRVEQVLILAETEAAQMRAGAAEEAEAAKVRVEEWAASLMRDAKRDAEQVHDEGERAARARLEEAEAYFEGVRANAGRLSAELETTLAARRRQAEQELDERVDVLKGEEAAAEEHAAQIRVDAQELRAETDRKVHRQLAEAERQARETVEAAEVAAERTRVESAHEVATAIALRDGIESQLASLRRAFGALGTVPPAVGVPTDNGWRGADTHNGLSP